MGAKPLPFPWHPQGFAGSDAVLLGVHHCPSLLLVTPQGSVFAWCYKSPGSTMELLAQVLALNQLFPGVVSAFMRGCDISKVLHGKRKPWGTNQHLWSSTDTIAVQRTSSFLKSAVKGGADGPYNQPLVSASSVQHSCPVPALQEPDSALNAL